MPRGRRDDGSATVFGQVYGLFRDVFRGWSRHHAPQIAAALAFFTVFSLAPVLFIVIAVAGFFYGERLVQEELIEQIAELIGEEGARQVQVVIQNASAPQRGIIASLIGFGLMIIGATAVFKQLKDAMNIVWSVERAEGRVLWRTLKDRLFSLAMVLCVAFLLLVSLVLSAIIAAVSEWVDDVLPATIDTLRYTNMGVSFVVITVLFAAIFKVLPDIRIRWKDVLPGAALTALLFSIGKGVVGAYLGRSGAASVYGAAGSIVVILMWVYYSAMIFLFGAEFTHAWARRFGSLSPASEAREMEKRAAERIEAAPKPAKVEEEDSIPLAEEERPSADA